MTYLANCTYCLPDDQLQRLLFTYSVFAIEGIVLAATNLMVFLAIIVHQVMRRKKQYVIIAGLTLINGTNGLASFIGGSSRVWFIFRGTANELRSKWQCFWTPWQQLWVWADPLVTVMLAIVSIDRLIAVVFPIHYFKFTYRYALLLVSLGYTYTFGNVIVAGFTSYLNQEKLYPKMCISAWTYDSRFYLFFVNQRVLWVVFSVVLYVFVVFFYRKSKAKVNTGDNGNREAKIQAKMTKSMGISCAITLACSLIPMLAEVIVTAQNASTGIFVLIASNAFTLMNMDSLLDVFIFTLRHKDLKLAIVYMFKCKELTQARLDQVLPPTAAVTRKRYTKQNPGEQQ